MFCQRSAVGISRLTAFGFREVGVNVENLSNKSRGEYAYTMVDLGTKVAERVIEDVQHMANVIRVRVLEW